jgi:hypothetical protein
MGNARCEENNPNEESSLQNSQQQDQDQDQEEELCKNGQVACFGIADYGQNKNVINPSFQGRTYGAGEAPPCYPEAYICLPKGTDCSRIIVGQDEQLNYVRGSGEPDYRRPQVKYCYPYNLYPDNGNEGEVTFPNENWKREVDRV